MDKATAAAYWSISERKFAELVAGGVIQPRRLGARCIRYAKADLDEASAKMPTGKGLGVGV